VTLSKRIAMIEPETLQTKVQEPNLRLVQVTSEQVYQQAHIPGAINVIPQALVCGVPPAVGRLPDKAALDALLSALAYTPEQHYVVFDDEGGGWAGRFAWTLDVIGHDGWTYLNGGLQAWHHAGLPLAQGTEPAPAPTKVDVTIHQDAIAEIPDVLAAIDDPQKVIWDARSAEEYAGIKQASARSGHIPGAINLDWLDVQDRNRQLRVVEHLETLLADKGISGKDGIITHCQSHHRSGLTYMLGRLLGLDIRAYHGSWSEWGNRDDTPIECP
jgi:thiosulfate/3-mercaptopyruvate sulfurtransferase